MKTKALLALPLAGMLALAVSCLASGSPAPQPAAQRIEPVVAKQPVAHDEATCAAPKPARVEPVCAVD